MNEAILHAAFIPFGEIKDVKTPLDQATQKHRSFGFVTFLEKEDANAAMDNMDGAELYGRVLTVNYALPERIKGGEQGWAAQPSEPSLSTPTVSLLVSLSSVLTHRGFLSSLSSPDFESSHYILFYLECVILFSARSNPASSSFSFPHKTLIFCSIMHFDHKLSPIPY